jgi:hypothetical protein
MHTPSASGNRPRGEAHSVRTSLGKVHGANRRVLRMVVSSSPATGTRSAMRCRGARF